jgi:hypothetical protein
MNRGEAKAWRTALPGGGYAIPDFSRKSNSPSTVAKHGVLHRRSAFAGHRKVISLDPSIGG